MFVERGIPYLNITGQFTKRGQVNQNIFLLVIDVTFFDITHGIFCVLLLFDLWQNYVFQLYSFLEYNYVFN